MTARLSMRTRRSPVRIKSPFNVLIGVLSVCAGIALWQYAASELTSSLLFPGPVKVAKALSSRSGLDLIGALGTTLKRVALGFALGSAVGATTGILAGNVKWLRTLVEPYVHFLRSIATLAWAGPALIWFGIGNITTEFLIFYSTVFIVLLNSIVGVTSIDEQRIQMARSFGATRLDVFLQIVLPGSFGYVLSGMRLAMSFSVATAISAEMLFGTNGVGYVIYESRLYFNFETIFAGLVILGVTGLVLDKIFTGVQFGLFARYRQGR